jgi:hypothetical protein
MRRVLVLALSAAIASPMAVWAAEFRAEAIALGVEIDRARVVGLAADGLEGWLAAVDSLQQRAQAVRAEAEADADEREAALEQLFRSTLWSDTGFAVAAGRYWRSWLLLDRDLLGPRSATRQDLEGARHGFQTTLALIVYPGLVRGAWLGLGYVALAESELELARVWFERVAREDDPLARTAVRELDLLAALDAPQSAPTTLSMTAAEADATEAQVLALLERHGRSLDGARAAAERLRRLEAAGQLTHARVLRLLAFRDEIIGHDIGPVGFLVSAEDALDHDQYYTAVQKYGAFYAALNDERTREFISYRPRYADALMLSGMPEAALTELSRDSVVAPALAQLAWAMVYAANGTDEARIALERSSGAASTPAAQFTAALLAGRPDQADAIRRRAVRDDDSWFARLPAFELVYRELAIHAPDPEAGSAYATLGLDLAKALPREVRRQSWVAIAEVEMAGYLEADVERYLAQLIGVESRVVDAAADDAAADAVRGALLSLRLRYLGGRDGERLIETLDATRSPLQDGVTAELLRLLLKCQTESWCLALAERSIELLADDPANALHARLRRIALLESNGQPEQAFYGARTLVDDYPNSGSAWEYYARAARQVGRSEDADRAFARIAASLPMGSLRWRETQLARLRIRVDAGAVDAACTLTQSLRSDAPTRSAAAALLDDRGFTCEG